MSMPFVMGLGDRGYVDHCQYGEYVCLDHADEQAQGMHDHGEEQRGDRQQDGDDLVVAHDVAEETDGQGQGPGELPHDVEREEDEGGLEVFLEVGEPVPRDPVDGHGQEDRD